MSAYEKLWGTEYLSTRALVNGHLVRENRVKQKDAFFGFSGKDKEGCDCGMCAPNNIDWNELTNTEKMVKATILKAQITAEQNGSLDITVL